jgi:chromosome segregation ATPase
MADLKLEAEQAGIRVKELVQQNDQQGAKIRQLNADLAKAIADRAILNDQKRQTAALLESMEAKIKELDDDVKARECCVNNQETVIIARDKEIAALQKRILDLEHGNGYRAQD